MTSNREHNQENIAAAKMNLQPSKLSDAANQVWKESASLFQAKDDVKVDLGLDKTLHRSTGTTTDNKAMISLGYVFGSKLSERVGTGNKKEFDDGPKDVSSIFKKISEKNASKCLWKSSENGSENSDRLKASIDELTKKSQTGAELNSSEPVTTGEEDERNLANISCKFFYYNVETKTWVERGMGVFKINQNKQVKDEIRMVGRTTGSQKVVLNSKIFAGMVYEQLTEKRLKISAQNPDSELPQLFIVQASPASIATISPLLEKYIARAKPMSTAPDSRKRKPDADETGIEAAKASEPSTKKLVKDDEGGNS